MKTSKILQTSFKYRPKGDADTDQVHPTGVGEDEQGGVARRPALRVGAPATEEAAEPQHGQDGDIQGGSGFDFQEPYLVEVRSTSSRNS